MQFHFRLHHLYLTNILSCSAAAFAAAGAAALRPATAAAAAASLRDPADIFLAGTSGGRTAAGDARQTRAEPSAAAAAAPGGDKSVALAAFAAAAPRSTALAAAVPRLGLRLAAGAAASPLRFLSWADVSPGSVRGPPRPVPFRAAPVRSIYVSVSQKTAPGRSRQKNVSTKIRSAPFRGISGLTSYSCEPIHLATYRGLCISHVQPTAQAIHGPW